MKFPVLIRFSHISSSSAAAFAIMASRCMQQRGVSCIRYSFWPSCSGNSIQRLRSQCQNLKTNFKNLSSNADNFSITGIFTHVNLPNQHRVNLSLQPAQYYLLRSSIETCRYIHTSCRVKNGRYEISQNDKDCYVNVKSATRSLNIPYIWLRDHCHSDKYYNHTTLQKNADPDLLKKDLIPVSIELYNGKRDLRITWTDKHITEYSFDFLVNHFYPGHWTEHPRQLWNSGIQSENLPVVSHKDYISTEKGLAQTLHNLVKYGFTLVNEAPATIEGTQKTVERITFVLETLFGKMWTFTSDGSRSDTAFSTQALGAHTDTTYFTTPAGLQVFQCLEHTGSGGETLLVDGFNAAELLRQSEPAAFQLLRETIIPHEYKELAGPNSGGYHMYSLGPVITTHPASGELLHIRFNPYDRAPLNTVPPEKMMAFYKAYSALSSIIASRSNELWIKLKPGTVLFIDNWRVLHGRSEFDGKRIMCGCYLPRDEWISRAKVLGVL